MLKRWAFVLSALFLLSAGTVPSAFAQAPMKLTLAHGIASDFLVALVAKDKGIFEKHGLDVTLSVITNGALAPQALVSGSVQITFVSGPLLMLGEDGGLDLVVVSGMSRIQKVNPHSSLITKEGVSVTKASDLIGKRVAVPGINSSLDLVFKKWLLDSGVRLDQVTSVELPFAQMGDALKSGQIDAAFPVEPMLARMLAGGGLARSVDIQSTVNPDFAASFWSSTREWATANPKAVAAFRDAMAEALVFIRDNPQDAKAIELAHLKFNDPNWPTFSLHVSPADLQFWSAVCLQLKQIHKPINGASLIFAGTP